MRDGSHRPATVAMYTNILKVILPQFKGVPIDEITGVRISQYLRWLRNDYRKPDGKPLAEKSIKHHYNVLNLIFGFAERQDIIVKNPMKKVDPPKVSKREVDALTEEEAVRFFNALLACDFELGDEAGGLNAVDQELKFLCFKLPLNDPPTPCPPIVLGFVAVFVQKVKIGADSFLLHRDFVVVISITQARVLRFSCSFVNSNPIG